MRYRRATTSGACWFFTVNLADRQQDLLVRHIDLLREVTRHVKQQHPFEIIAMVVMPGHLHAIWQLPPGDSDYPMRWSLIKAGFSRGIAKTERIRESRVRKRERGIWQRRYWEHLIRDDKDLQAHVDYIHFNPVKHGYCAKPVDWSYSSIHRYITAGWITPDWAIDCDSGRE
ncbi:REP-associated tyrosine transposase [Aeromonas australiensis]|uniref:REP-associated tyrosine transposase n=1 Tax=Aeromonas australiensis TaxID=1114880 RepID=UPI000589F0D1|nr:transposase [Aeromonas australiensis]